MIDLRKLKKRLKRRIRSDNERHPVSDEPTSARHRFPPPVPLVQDYALVDEGLAVLQMTDLDPVWSSTPVSGRLSLLEEVHDQIWAGRILTTDWCQRLISEVVRYRTWNSANQAPNTMHEHGVMLADLGLSSMIKGLGDELEPLARQIFDAHFIGESTNIHAYVVEYGDHADRQLGFHVDDSQFTLNLCLGERFDGAEIYFEGPRCALHVDTPSQPEERFEWTHQPGWFLLHAGKNRHGVKPIRTGRRFSLILWFRDATGRRRWEEDWENGSCPPWCGAHSDDESSS